MKGQLGVDSELGQGSTFWFEVWLQLDPTATFELGPMPSTRRNPAVRRVLVVEDDPHNAVVLRAMLERSQCEVTLVADGRTALNLYTSNTYDLVLLDLYLPDMDGREVARRLRASESLRNATRTPIVAQTASTGTGDIFGLKGVGIDGFLAKPIQKKNLIQILNRFAPLPDKSTATPRRKSTKPGFKVHPAKTDKQT
jgi:CheY-like chemotaxis protein